MVVVGRKMWDVGSSMDVIWNPCGTYFMYPLRNVLDHGSRTVTFCEASVNFDQVYAELSL